MPVIFGCDCNSALAAARAIAGNGLVLLVGIVPVHPNDSLSSAAGPARQVRQMLKSMAQGDNIRIDERVHAVHHTWDELVKITQKERPDLLILDWEHYNKLGSLPNSAILHPPCDLAIIQGPIPSVPASVLIPIRGGPYAELAVRLSIAIARNNHSEITSLHITLPNIPAQQDAAFRNLERVLVQMPEIHREKVTTDHPIDVIMDAARHHDLIVMGATAKPESSSSGLGPVAETFLKERPCGVIILKTRRPAPVNFETAEASSSAISVLVDKWFAENTYQAAEFADLDALIALKQKQGVTISLALPALNEEETVGNVIRTVKQALMDEVPLLDEIVLVDSDSTDNTREIAKELGIPVHIHQRTLPQYGARRGKGEALWKSLYLTHGDIILWVDTDIFNMTPHFVYGLIGPLLLRPEVQLVKGFYQRPLRVGDKLQAGGGGRVTELSARPLLNLLYPELSGLIQPLAGEYGGRRKALERLPFSSTYGVEIGLLIDTLETFGINAIAQVDLEERIHHNQPLEALSKMSFVILQTVFHKLEKRYGHSLLDEANRSMKLIRYEPQQYFLEVQDIPELERPPMMEIPEYRERYKV